MVRHAQPDATQAKPVPREAPITLQVVATQRYDALTIRSVSRVLGTGPSPLYAHIVDKADIDELLIGRLCAQVVLPEPDPARRREQIRDVCVQTRDLYPTYPGISRAALAMVSTNLETLRVSEGMFSISPYVAGYAWEASMVRRRLQDRDAPWVLDQEELVRRFSAFPEAAFPSTRKYATELTSGSGHQRFDFALGLLVDSLGREIDG